MKTVLVVVELRVGCHDIDDVEGVWQADLHRDLPAPLAAGAALDTFHRKVAISELENYDIDTVDPDTFESVSEPDDYEQGGEQGSVEVIAGSIEDLRAMRARR